MKRWTVACILGSLSLADGGMSAWAGPDNVEQALAEVRDVKAELFSRQSSVLGTLPGPVAAAAHQLRCRALPVAEVGRQRDLPIDSEVEQYAAELDLDQLKQVQSRMSSRGLPLGITGACVTEFIGRTELLVTRVLDDTPATDVLQVDDMIFGANGRRFRDTEDPRPEMGNALVESQTPELGGILTLHVVRDRKPLNLKIDLGSTLAYSDTWPFDCGKTRQVCQAAVDYVIDSHPWHRYNFWTPTFLMACGDDRAFELARRHLCAGFKEDYPEGRGCSAWVFSYRLLNLCEYYLLTGDSAALPSIRYHAECLAWAQYRSGSWSHGGDGTKLRAPGTAFGGYGEVNNAGLASFAALTLARQCGVEPYDHTLPRSIRFFGQFCGTNFPYGLGRPGGRAGRMDNGMNAMAAFGFRALGEDEMAERWARTVCYMWMGRERGHADAIFSAAWGPVGAALAPRGEAIAFTRHMLWAYEMGRTPDGAIAFMRGSRWTYPNMTAAMGLMLCLPQRRLQILGAEKSVFAQHPPKGMEQAAQLYQEKKWHELQAFLDGVLQNANPSDPAAAIRTEYAKRLLAAYQLIERQAAVTLKLVPQNIEAGKFATAQLQLDILQRLLGEERPEAARLRKLLGDEPRKDPKPAEHKPWVDWKKFDNKELGLVKGGVGDGFACSPAYIERTNAEGFDGMTVREIAGFLAHPSGGPAAGAAAALAARGDEALPLLKQLLGDSHPGLRSGAAAALRKIFEVPKDAPYRTEVPADLAETIQLVRPMTTDESSLVRAAVGEFVVSIKVLNNDAYDMIFEMARQGASGLDGFARHAVKDPEIRARLCMTLARTALRGASESPSAYKPILYPAMAHLEECGPYVQTALDLMDSSTVLNLYGFFSNCPRDAAMRILFRYVDDPLVMENLPVILEVSYHHGRGDEVNVYSYHSVEYPHRIVLQLGPPALPVVDRFLESKRALLERIESGQEEPPAWWKDKVRPDDFDIWFENWRQTKDLVGWLHSDQSPDKTIPPLCAFYLADRAWGEWERAQIRDKLIDSDAAAVPILRRALESALPPLLSAIDKRLTAKQAEIDAADKKTKRPLERELEEIGEEKAVLEQRAEELREFATLMDHLTAEQPSQKAVDFLCQYCLKRDWGTEFPHRLGETSYVRPLFAKPLALVRDTLVSWGKPALPMIRRFQQQDQQTLAAALSDLDEQEAYWKTQWSRKAADPLSRIGMERFDLPQFRADLDDLAHLIDCHARDRLADEDLTRLCQIYTRYDCPEQRTLIREILQRCRPQSTTIVKQHVQAEEKALPDIESRIEAMFGNAVVPRVCVEYDRLKATVANVRRGIEELEEMSP